jgi:hypothetical protein
VRWQFGDGESGHEIDLEVLADSIRGATRRVLTVVSGSSANRASRSKRRTTATRGSGLGRPGDDAPSGECLSHFSNLQLLPLFAAGRGAIAARPGSL